MELFSTWERTRVNVLFTVV